MVENCGNGPRGTDPKHGTYALRNTHTLIVLQSIRTTTTPFKSTSPNLPRHAKDNQKRKPKPGDSARCGRAAPYDGPDYLEIAPSWRAMLEDSCPFSFYRISVDVAPQFESTVHNLNRAY